MAYKTDKLLAEGRGGITHCAIMVDRRKIYQGGMVLSILVTSGIPVLGALEIGLAKVILVAVFRDSV